MSKASNLIESIEAKTGQRIDSNNGDNDSLVLLFGTIARGMGKVSPSFTQRDDFAIGTVIKHHISEEGQKEEEANKFLADMLNQGVSPDMLNLSK